MINFAVENDKICPINALTPSFWINNLLGYQ